MSRMDVGQSVHVDKNATVPGQLKKLAGEKPHKPAFVFVDKNLKRTAFTRKEVWDLSRKYANYFRRNGLKKGDVICNCLVNSPERLLTTYGAIIAGVQVLHGQTLLADGEDFILNLKTSFCKAVLLDPTLEKGSLQFLDARKYREEETGKVRYRDLPNLEKLFFFAIQDGGSVDKIPTTDDDQTFLMSYPPDDDFYDGEALDAGDIACLYVTSGTTGYSKVVPHTHSSCLFFGSNFAFLCGIYREESVFLNDRSMGWIGGQPMVYPVVGCVRVYIDHRCGLPTDAGAHYYQLLTQESCEYGFMVPLHLILLLDAIEAKGGKDVPFRFRRIGSGGGPIPAKIVDNLHVLTDAFSYGYGSTEATIISALSLEKGDTYEPFCVGPPLPGVELKVVDEDLKELPTGKPGELLIRSRSVAKCYLNQPDKTKSAMLPDGWFKTGDMSFVNDKGQLFVFSRKSDAIMRGSFVQYPGWMESRMAKCPGVKSVTLVGVPDEKLHEEVCACIITLPGSTVTEESLQSFCETIFLSTDSKEMTPIPKYFLFFDQFPTSQNGKILRPALKEEARKRLGL